MTPTRSNAEPWRSAITTPAVASSASPSAEKTRVASSAQAASASEAPRRRNWRNPKALATSGPAGSELAMAPAANEIAVNRPVPRATPPQRKQPLVEAGEGDEGQGLDRDGDQQPADIEVRELARSAGQLAPCDRSPPRARAAPRAMPTTNRMTRQVRLRLASGAGLLGSECSLKARRYSWSDLVSRYSSSPNLPSSRP